MLQGFHILLGVTFMAVIIGTLAECRPFSHYWRVVPDPGPSCRQMPAQFIILATTHGFTNLALVVFPIPMIFQSRIPTKRYPSFFKSHLRLFKSIFCHVPSLTLSAQLGRSQLPFCFLFRFLTLPIRQPHHISCLSVFSLSTRGRSIQL